MIPGLTIISSRKNINKKPNLKNQDLTDCIVTETNSFDLKRMVDKRKARIERLIQHVNNEVFQDFKKDSTLTQLQRPSFRSGGDSDTKVAMSDEERLQSACKDN